MRLTLLGTGTSFGVPQVGCDCAVCRSADPRDRRSRTSALVEGPEGTILIDTPPELRLQLLGAGVRTVDAVLFTHAHADHVAGIDDLRVFSVNARRPVPVYGPAETIDRLRDGYRYIFDDAVRPPPGTSKPRLTPHVLEPGRTAQVAGMPVLPVPVPHGDTTVFGYRIGPLAYVTDVKQVGPDTVAALQGVEVLVLGALWWRPHPTHQSIGEAVAAAQAIGARRTLLTHLTHETGHADLAARLPPLIAPASDGLVVEFP
ncbi:MAG TPA: MBL fold metallo-hydrolase [Gemmatimonadales bacterium]|nr:MBL fold metallo-hydrolase [Gemmatimonadales bacterium]